MDKMTYRETKEAQQVDFVAEKEDWTIYKLSDGTVLKIKVVLVNIVRTSEHDPMTGNPIYAISTQLIVNSSSPQHLKKSITNKKDPAVR